MEFFQGINLNHRIYLTTAVASFFAAKEATAQSGFLLPSSWQTSSYVAAVYRGRPGCSDCAEAAAELLQRALPRLKIVYVGPRETQPLNREILSQAQIYVQPGGDESVREGAILMRRYASDIRYFVQQGGRYLGICMGGYLAGSNPGFELLQDSESERYVGSENSKVDDDSNTLVKMTWRNLSFPIFFQDGPFFFFRHDPNPGTQILARYAHNQAVAAMISTYGLGKVGVIGPHPEAPEAWYKQAHLDSSDTLHVEFGTELVRLLME